MDFLQLGSFMSPALGAATGQGFGRVLPFLSPAYGAISGRGPFSLGGHTDSTLAAATQPFAHPQMPMSSNTSVSPLSTFGNALSQGGQQGSQDTYTGLSAFHPIQSSALAYLNNYLGQL